MTQTHRLTGTVPRTVERQRRAWPLSATAAGLGGLLAVLLPEDPGTRRAAPVLGHLAVVLLLVAAAHWRCRVETRVPRSVAAHVVPLGLVASAASLACLSLVAEGDGLADPTGWLGVVVAAGAVAWMAFRERTVSRWIGVVSVLPVVLTTLAVVGAPVRDVAGPLGPLWLVVVGLGLAVGRSTIVR